MWPFDKPNARRLEIRRTKAERSRAVASRFLDPGRIGFTFVTLCSALLAALILNIGGQQISFREGQYLTRPIASRVAFPVADPKQTDEMRIRAAEASPSYFELDGSLLDEIRGRLSSALTLAKAHIGNPEALIKEAATNKIPLDAAAAAQLISIAESDATDDFARRVESALGVLVAVPLARPAEEALRRTTARAVLVNAQTGSERAIEMSRVVFVSNTEAVDALFDRSVAAFQQALRGAFKSAMLAGLRSGEAEAMTPLYRFSDARTAAAAQAAREAVAPQFLQFGANDILATVGKLDADAIELLRAEHEAWLAAVNQSSAADAWIEWFGRSLLVFIVVFGVATYVTRYQRIGFGNAKDIIRRTASAGVMLGLLAIARLAFVWSDAPPHLAVGTQAVAAGLLAIIYPPGVVFAVSAGLAMLITMAVQQSLTFFVILMIVSGAFVFGLGDVRNRGKIVIVGLSAAVAAAIATICGALINGQPGYFAVYQGAWAAGSTLLAAFVLEGVLPGVERVFRLSTGMTLLEWCDANKPLLRLMAVDAPGTYNHSLLVGALAESAAESIGANGLLARAGAYYHDIGKINKPEYFVENQTAGVNRHERLSPAMSLLIIIGHVKDGIEMAKEYKIPASLRPFIAEHHGTTLVEYFYHAANRMRRPDDPEVSDSSFRYPGPKPQSRETAIVMLADGVEGAVRAMSDPTPGRIEAVVSEIVRKRLMDGQFDECELTFRELAEIEKSLIKSLCGIYHARVVYPDAAEDEPGERRVAQRVEAGKLTQSA